MTDKKKSIKEKIKGIRKVVDDAKTVAMTLEQTIDGVIASKDLGPLVYSDVVAELITEKFGEDGYELVKDGYDVVKRFSNSISQYVSKK